MFAFPTRGFHSPINDNREEQGHLKRCTSLLLVWISVVFVRNYVASVRVDSKLLVYTGTGPTTFEARTGPQQAENRGGLSLKPLCWSGLLVVMRRPNTHQTLGQNVHDPNRNQLAIDAIKLVIAPIRHGQTVLTLCHL